MEHQWFVDRVQTAAALASRDDAMRLVRLVLEALGQQLQAADAYALAARVAASVGRHLDGRVGVPVRSFDALVTHVAMVEHATPHDARRHAEAVLAVVADAAPDALAELRSRLPADWAAALRPTGGVPGR